MVLVETPEDSEILTTLCDMVSLALHMPFDVDLWKVQNIYWGMLHTSYPEYKQSAGRNDTQASKWIDDFTSLGKLLKIRVG